MPTRKQRKRIQKERRHEWESVWIHPDGTESDEPPEDFVEPASREKGAASKPKSTQKRSSRPRREPQPPSWRRSVKRAVLLGAAIFVFVAITVHAKSGQSKYVSAAYAAVLFAGLFIPYIYGIERFTYRRYQRRLAEQPKKKQKR